MEPLVVRLILALAAVPFGLNVGSFVNVLIYRLPRERSVVHPRSHCFCCGTPLAGRDLLPLVSSWLAGGRCRYCGVALAGQYNLVEAACGLLFGLLVYRWGVTVSGLTYCAVAAVLLAACGTDLKHKIIPTQLNVALAALALGGSVAAWLVDLADPRRELRIIGAAPLPTPLEALAGMLVGYVVFEAIVRLGRLIFRQEAMGGGDVLLAAAVGALLGPGRRFAAFCLLGILTGALWGLLLILTGRLSRREPMAFGPFLVVGTWWVMLFPRVADWIAALYGFGPPEG